MWLTTLKRRFGSTSTKTRRGASSSQSKQRRARLAVEALEDRVLLSSSPVIFQQVQNTGLPSSAGTVAVGDFNNDGFPDLFVNGQTSSAGTQATVASGIYQNNGDGTFTLVPTNLPQKEYAAAGWADTTNSGNLDLLVTGNQSTPPPVLKVGPLQLPTMGLIPTTLDTRLYHNNGDGTFTNVGLTLPLVTDATVAWGDYDNDGLPDFAISGLTPGGTPITQIYHNDGHDAFRLVAANLPGVVNGTLSWVDTTGDGLLDLLITGSTGTGHGAFDGITQLWHNDGNGTFSLVNTPFPGVTNSAVAWADYDKDGRPDLLLTGDVGLGQQPETFLFHNDSTSGNTAFHLDAAAGLVNVASGSVAWGDYNKDGSPDVAISGLNIFGNPVTEVYRNNGDGTFTDLQQGLPGVAHGTVAWADFDNDGLPDLVVSGLTASGSPLLNIYHQLEPVSPTPTAAYEVPTGTIGTATSAGPTSQVVIDFNVLRDATVSQLGVFDNAYATGSDPEGELSTPLMVSLVDRTAKVTNVPLATLTFGANTDYSADRIGSTIFQPLAKSIFLQAGFQGELVVTGYVGSQSFASSSTANPSWFVNQGGDVIQFPASSTELGAGNLIYEANVTDPEDPLPDPTTALPIPSVTASSPNLGSTTALTDGLLGPAMGLANSTNSSAWAGWRTPPPSGITFTWSQAVSIAQIQLYVNNSGETVNGETVGLYDSVTATLKGPNGPYTAVFVTTPAQMADPAARWITYSLDYYKDEVPTASDPVLPDGSDRAKSGLMATSVRLTFASSTKRWLLLGEARFVGLSDQSVLTVKRVPGYQPTTPFNASPYLDFQSDQRFVGSNQVDYWELNLNPGDVIGLTTTPSNVMPYIRLFNPAGVEVANSSQTQGNGLSYGVPARAGGTYTIGFSNSDYTTYGFAPTLSQPDGSTVSIAFNFELKMSPGPQSSALRDWLDQAPSEAENNNWSLLSQGQQLALKDLDIIANEGAAKSIQEFLKFPGGFENLSQYQDLSTYLQDTWNTFGQLTPMAGSWLPTSTLPFDLSPGSSWLTAGSSSTQTASTVWSQIQTDFLNNYQDFVSVHDLLLEVDSQRSTLSAFLANYKQVVNNISLTVKGIPEQVVSLLDEPGAAQLVTPVTAPENSFDITGAIFDTFSAAAQTALATLAPEASVLIYGLGALLGDVFNYCSASSVSSTSVPPFSDANQLEGAAQDLDGANQAAFSVISSLLTSGLLASSIYNNLGELEAFQNLNLSTDYNASTIDAPTVSDPDPATTEIQDAYKLAAYKQFVPRLFQWEESSLTVSNDPTHSNLAGFFNGQQSAPVFGNFFPIVKQSNIPDGTFSSQADPAQTYGEAQQALYSLDTTGSFSYPDSLQFIDGTADLTDVRSEFLHTAGTVTPHPASNFYSLEPAAVTGGFAYNISNPTGASIFIDNLGDVGYYINSWELISRSKDSNGNYDEISPDAAQRLFGTFTSDPAPYNNLSLSVTSSGQGYFNIPTQGGLATPAAVFAWGQDVGNGFAPSSIPAPNSQTQYTVNGTDRSNTIPMSESTTQSLTLTYLQWFSQPALLRPTPIINLTTQGILSPNGSQVLSSLSFSVRAPAQGMPVPTGSVSIWNGTQLLQTIALNNLGNSVGSFDASILQAGEQVFVVYNPVDTNYVSTSQELPQTTLRIINTPVAGSSISFNATVESVNWSGQVDHSYHGEAKLAITFTPNSTFFQTTLVSTIHPFSAATNGIFSVPYAVIVPGTYTITANDVAVPFVTAEAMNQHFTTTVTGGGQQTLHGTAFTSPLTVTVKSAFGQSVAGDNVTFTSEGNGAGATFSSSTATLNSAGQASVTATANGIPGTYTVLATVSGIAAAVTFNLTNVYPLVLTVPRDETVSATSTAGAAVKIASATASGYQASITYLTASGAPITPGVTNFPVGTSLIQVRAADSQGDVAFGSFHVNVLSFASPGGPYTILPGQSLTLNDNGSVVAPGTSLIYTWIINGAEWRTQSGPALTLSWAFLLGRGIRQPGTYPIQLIILDSHGAESKSIATTLTVLPLASAGGPYTIMQGQSLTLDGSASQVAAKTHANYSWTINGQADAATGVKPTLTWNQLRALGVPGGTGTFTVQVQVDDGQGHVATSMPATTVTVLPLVAPNGPFTIREGQSLPLSVVTSGSPAAPGLKYIWIINGHADAATGLDPVVKWAQLQALGIDDGPATFPIQVQVVDGLGDVATSTATTLTLNNSPPTASLSGPATGVAGQSLTFTLSASDPSATDQAAGFSYTINWGDGSAVQTVAQTAGNGTGVSVSHTYAKLGVYSVQMVAIDKDDGGSTMATLPVTISA